MNLGKITLITPPDKLFNLTLSYLLVKPSVSVKQQFHTILSRCVDDINVFIYDEKENDIDWLLSVAGNVDVIVVDVDNCDETTKIFISYLLAQPNTHFITTDETTPYNLINKNRIYNLDQIAEKLASIDDEDEEEEEDE